MRTLSISYYLLAGVLMLTAACSDSDDDEPNEELGVEMGDGGASPDDAVRTPADGTILPIVFVHGGAGSAQQYASQAIRFALNGYPQEQIVGYDHDGQGFDVEPFLAGLDEVVNGVRTKFDADQVYLVGHSRGTLVSSRYLSDPERAAKVAKYISLDGGPCDGIPVPCIGPNQAALPGQKHVEVATSKESFAMQYEFLMGKAPDTIDIEPQSGPVELRGRAVNFPANTGRDGARLEFWEIDGDTGYRTGDDPVMMFDLGPDGAWGPAMVEPGVYYELVLYDPGSESRQHFYPQPYVRDSFLERLLSGPPDSPTRMNSNVGDGTHTGLTVLRMREWLPSDVLEVETKRPDGKGTEKTNVITDDNVPLPEMGMGLGVGEPIAIYLHDDVATPTETTLELLPWFPEQFFQTGIDVFMPAADPPDGTITLTNFPRGDESKAQTMNVPNWRMDKHTVMVLFSDFPH